MKNNTKRKILIVLSTCLTSFGVICGIFIPKHEIKNIIDETQEIVQNEITEIEEQELIENPSTKEIPDLAEEDEQTIEVQETESEAFEEQGEVAYNGSDKAHSVSVGSYAGLTYYSQTDSRWGYKMYSNHGDGSQTIANSGCGPTSASMIVSSIRGTITPDKMSDLYVNNGYRSYNAGTYWSAFRWTADVFNIDYSETTSLENVVDKLRDNHYIIASCGNGLFTYGGHFIAIMGIEGDTLKIYDPYLYAGKFDTSTRRNKVSVNGNTVYCSVENFRYYANARRQNRANGNYYANGYKKNVICNITQFSGNWGLTPSGWVCLSYCRKMD